MVSANPTSKRSLLSNLQLMRFLWAGLVVWFHASLQYQDVSGATGWTHAINTFAFAGVDAFFVISGYIMWHINRNMHRPRGALAFLYHRMARIYLGYWPFLAASLFAFWIFVPQEIARFNLLASFLLLPQTIIQPLELSWTLSLEVYFYLLFFVVLFFRRRLLVLVAISAVVLASNIYAYSTFDLSALSGFWNWPYAVRFALSPWLLEFLAGSLLAALCERTRRFAWQSLVASCVLIAAGGVCNVMFFDANLTHWAYQFERVAIFGSAMVLQVYGMVALEHGGVRFLPRLARWGGDASYAMYLLHPIPMIVFTWTGFTAWLGAMGVPADVYILSFTVLVTLFSVGWYERVEGPLYRRAKRLL